MTEQELQSLPESVETDGQVYFLAGTGGGQIRYESADGQTIEFADCDLRTLIRNAHTQ